MGNDAPADLIFGLWSEFIGRSVHAGLQVSVFSGKALGHAR